VVLTRIKHVLEASTVENYYRPYRNRVSREDRDSRPNDDKFPAPDARACNCTARCVFHRDKHRR